MQRMKKLRISIKECMNSWWNNQIPICRKAWKRGIRLWRRFFALTLTSELGLTVVRSRSRENNTQLFSNTLAPLRYACLLGKRFSIQRALSSRIGRSQARYSVASLLTMCSRHSLASFLVALPANPKTRFARFREPRCWLYLPSTVA